MIHGFSQSCQLRKLGSCQGLRLRNICCCLGELVSSRLALERLVIVICKKQDERFGKSGVQAEPTQTAGVLPSS